MADYKDEIRPEYDYKMNTIEGRRFDNRRVFFVDENDYKITLYGKDGFESGKVYKFYDFQHYCDVIGNMRINHVTDGFDYPTYDELKDRCDKALFDSDLKVYGIAIDEENNTVAVDINGNINTYTLTPEQIEELPGFIDNVSPSKEEFDDICMKLAYDPSRDLYDALTGFDSVWDDKENKVTFKIDVNGEERTFDLSRVEAAEISTVFDHKGTEYWQDENLEKGYLFETEHCFTLEEFADKLAAYKNGQDMEIFTELNRSASDVPKECILNDQKGNFVIEVDNQLLAVDKDSNIRKVDIESIPYPDQIIKIDENFTLNNFGGRVAVADVLMQIENKSIDLGVSLDGNPVQKDIQNSIKRLDNIKEFSSDFCEGTELLPAEKAYLSGMQKALSDKDFKLTDFRSAEMAVINDMVVSNKFFIEDIKEAVANNSPFCVSKYGEGQADYLVNDCVNAVARDRYSREVAINKARGSIHDFDPISYSPVFDVNKPETYYLKYCNDCMDRGLGYVAADKIIVRTMLDKCSVDEVKDVVIKCSPVFAGNPSGAVSFVDEVKAEKDAEKQKLEKAREKIRESEKAHSNALDSSKDKPKEQSTKKNQNSGSGSGHGHSGNTGR